MKYFFDTEFIEGISNWTFAKNRHYIDLISIGIVAEDGREYYAISNEFNPKDANEWVYKNVLQNILLEWVKSYSGDGRNKILDSIEGSGKFGGIKLMQKTIGKSNAQIAKEIRAFVNPKGIDDVVVKVTRADCWAQEFYPKEFDYIEKHNTFIPKTIWKSGDDGTEKNKLLIYNQPEFYGYYADYDWVLLASLFGRMLDLPKGFPMYCRDLKQMLDEEVMKHAIGVDKALKNGVYPVPDKNRKPVQQLFDQLLQDYKDSKEYPKQHNEHNALDDARWNQKLFHFIKQLK